MKNILFIVIIVLFPALAMTQCPPNINFSNNDFANWGAYTGNFAYSPYIQQTYPSNTTAGLNSINEYGLTAPGITIMTATNDPFGAFPTIPTINGYDYKYSILLGSTTITNGNAPVRGGYVRGIQYVINVPAGLPTDPYTITYAYAMVLENGSHTTSNQPIFHARVTSPGGDIACASATYNLPTTFVGFSNTNGGRPDSIFTMDESYARQQGFDLSPVPSPNNNGNRNESPYRVWYKPWTEVTFNLAPYRGQQVTLTFEADNCVPGGHFAYAYVALRNDCGGLEISGPAPACDKTPAAYSIPSLANATYTWSVPPGWQITSSANTNIITVLPGNVPGTINVTADNGCTKLNSSLAVSTVPPTIPGKVTPDFKVCTGTNSSTLTLQGQSGRVLNWIASTDGINWMDVGNANNTSYTARNLTSTTYYKAVVQNGTACKVDTSEAATVTVYQKSVGGTILPSAFDICINQNKNANLTVENKIGDVLNWQYSYDNAMWNDFSPAVTDSFLNIKNQTENVKYYRAVVQVGVCPAEVSSASKVTLINALFPQAALSPKDTTICFGDTATLNTAIISGTSFQWGNQQNLLYTSNSSNIPKNITAFAFPSQNAIYPISIYNSGCPNAFVDTFTVNVLPPIQPVIGKDTFIVVGQPLQLQVSTNGNSENYSYLWTPSLGLSNPFIANPVADLNNAADSIKYTVAVTENNYGCTEKNSITVKVFKTEPEIFVPNAFTPNSDGRNDILKPIPVGISQFNYFKVYNRYGQLVFSTTNADYGWDGTLNGKEQPLGVYIWMTGAISYTGKKIERKGTVTLIR